jgi:hypothetical protein
VPGIKVSNCGFIVEGSLNFFVVGTERVGLFIECYVSSVDALHIAEVGEMEGGVGVFGRGPQIHASFHLGIELASLVFLHVCSLGLHSQKFVSAVQLV